MTHHTNDAFGGETPRPQDRVPIDESGRLPVEAGPEAEHNGNQDARSDAGEQQAPHEPNDLKGLAGLATSSTSGASAEQTRPRRRANRSAKSSKPREPIEETPTEVAASVEGTALDDLEARGFTPAEARRLIGITARLEQSAESREAEATRRRLQFTRWLLDHGRLDEWSA